MNWTALLGLDGLAAHWRRRLGEAAAAGHDRLALARLEWAEQRHYLWRLALLLVLLGALALGTLLFLSLAVLVQYWDTPQRSVVAWLLVLAWALACAALLLALYFTARHVRQLFALTRHELAQDWQALREQLP
ncbi:phage holin family protein [Comamonas sp. NLF-1-9]|uniref:phage holin family protein n=1 Tax=Comamonas sp. NLF-1-9 TaxID=2853163 RepID=UPI001C44EA80|nr:phage holin family protein [Comamonas sp. NLF-1-9]QXL83576.1 phage holin family protein [Comamonas sp. NLF-1-9]